MIGFGELRKLSVQWQVDLAAVEAAYATDWLVKGIYDHPVLSPALVLTGSAALRYAYSAAYPETAAPEFRRVLELDEDALRAALREAARTAGQASGLQFMLSDVERGAAKVEYVGPLGRRSAAQPKILLAIISGTTHLAPLRQPLVHPFGDACRATVSAIALEEFIAERAARLRASPRAHDVYDLWYAWQLGHDRIDLAATRALIRQIAQARNTPLPAAAGLFSSAHRDILARTWDTALRSIRTHPAFDQVETDLTGALRVLWPVHDDAAGP